MKGLRVACYEQQSACHQGNKTKACAQFNTHFFSRADHKPSNSFRWSSSVSWCLILASLLSATQYSAGLIFRL